MDFDGDCPRDFPDVARPPRPCYKGEVSPEQSEPRSGLNAGCALATALQCGALGATRPTSVRAAGQMFFDRIYKIYRIMNVFQLSRHKEHIVHKVFVFFAIFVANISQSCQSC